MHLYRFLVALVFAWVLSSPSALAGEATITPTVKNPERHAGFLADITKMAGNIDLVFVGDSITDHWRGFGKVTWQKDFAPLKALNLGIGGDRTQHVLWRLQNGELEGYKAKAFVVMIGTNNGHDSAESVALGVQAILKEIQTRQPQAKILLLGIFPRGDKPNPARAKNDAANVLIAKYADGKTVRYLDIGAKFLAPDKEILPKDIMPDALHPNAKGYEIWAEAIIDPVKGMLAGK